MRRATFICIVAILIGAVPRAASAAEAPPCTINRAALSFVTLESPLAIDGRCCDTIQRIRALRPTISISARCEEGAEGADPFCAAGSLGEVRLSDADLVPDDAGCFAFHIAFPIPPDARHLWEREIAVAVVTKAIAKAPSPPGAPAVLVLAHEGRPQFALAHEGFDTDASGRTSAANLRVNVVPHKNPPFKVRYAFPGGQGIVEGSGGEVDVPPTGRVDVPLPSCAGGTLVAGLVYSNADGAFIDALMEAAEKQKGGALPKATPSTIFSPREEWEIALVEGALELGLASAGYLFIVDPGAVADNFQSIALPAAPAGCKAN